MKSFVLALGWFVLIVLGLVVLFLLTVVAFAAFSELVDRIKARFKK